MSHAATTTATIIPCLRYRDAAAMITWLGKAFGFREHMVVKDDDGSIAHAQLSFGNGMIMLGSIRDDQFGHKTVQPADVGGATQSPYVVVADPAAHHAMAVAAGAEIMMAPKDQDYGGRLYSCKDPEGHIWYFGSYDPWVPEEE